MKTVLIDGLLVDSEEGMKKHARFADALIDKLPKYMARSLDNLSSLESLLLTSYTIRKVDFLTRKNTETKFLV